MSSAALHILSSPIFTALALLGMYQLANHIDMTDPQVILVLRVIYAISKLLCIPFFIWLRSKINRIGDKKHFVEIQRPAMLFSEEGPKTIKMTVCEYDLSEVSTQIKLALVTTSILVAVHLYTGYAHSFIYHALYHWKNLLTLPVVRVHLWGCKAEGDLARPWIPALPFAKKDEAKPAKKSD